RGIENVGRGISCKRHEFVLHGANRIVLFAEQRRNVAFAGVLQSREQPLLESEVTIDFLLHMPRQPIGKRNKLCLKLAVRRRGSCERALHSSEQLEGQPVLVVESAAHLALKVHYHKRNLSLSRNPTKTACPGR